MSKGNSALSASSKSSAKKKKEVMKKEEDDEDDAFLYGDDDDEEDVQVDADVTMEDVGNNEQEEVKNEKKCTKKYI